MPGKICCIYGCHSTSRYLEKWRDCLCAIHGTNRRFCVCLEPFRLIPFPTERKDPELRKEWINIVNINRSQKGDKSKHYLPSESSRICSEHFESPESKLPSLNLIYDPEAAQKRKSTAKKKVDKNVKKRKRECLSENKNFIAQEENVPNSVQFQSAIDFSGDENDTSTKLDHDNSDNNDCDNENIRFDYLKETDTFPTDPIKKMKDFKKKKHIYKRIPRKITMNCNVETQTDPEVPDDSRIDQPQTTACLNVPNDCLDFRKTLYQFHLNGFLCDTIIRTKDSVMNAHSCVLAAKSSRLLTSVFSANHENGSIIYDLDFSNYETIVVKMALDYIYLGEVTDVEATEEHIVESRFSKFLSLVKTLGIPLDEFEQFLNKSVGCLEKNTNDDVEYTHRQDVVGSKAQQDVVGSKAHQDVGSKAHQDVGSKAHLNVGLEALLSVISKACQDAGSKDNQDVGSKAHRDVGSKANQDVKSKAHQDVGTKAHQDVGSKAHQDVGSTAHQDIDSKAHQDVGSKSHLNFGLEALRTVISKACQDAGSKVHQGVGSLATHQFSIVETVLPPPRTSLKIGNTIFILPASQESIQTHDLPLNSEQAPPAFQVTTEKHICEICGMEFSHETDLQMHTWHAHVAVFERYDTNLCSICSRGFKHMVSLNNHMKLKHGVDVSQSHPTDQAPPTSNGTSKQAPPTKQAPLIKQAPPTSEVTTEKHICEKCGLEFLDETDLRMHTYHVHLSIFEVSDNYLCSICSQGFKYEGRLNAHMRKKHEVAPVKISPKEFLCDLCGKFFSSKCQVEQHRNRTHSDLSPYKCVVCGKSFKSRSGMHFHTRIHLAEKNFACPTCAKCFRTKREVHTHMETHKAVKRRKGFSCRICNRQFASQVNVRRHMMMKHHSVCVVDQDLGPEAEELFGPQSQ